MLSLNPEKLHHAYLLVGDATALEEEVLAFVKDELSFPIQANPDFVYEREETLTIEKARELQEMHILRPFEGERRIFVLILNSITLEAQNALLKLFEEPISGNHFFLILGDDRSILPTLRSRMEVYRHSREANSELGKSFLTASLAERLETVSRIAEEKDKEGARDLLRALLLELRKKDFSLKDNGGILKDILKADDYLSDRAPSIKILLEHIAHTAPRW